MDIYRLAGKAAEAKILYEALVIMNTRDTRGRAARDAWLAAEAEYQRVLNRMSADELRRAVG